VYCATDIDDECHREKLKIEKLKIKNQYKNKLNKKALMRANISPHFFVILLDKNKIK